MVKLDKTEGEVNIQAHNMNEMLELILKRLRPIAAERNIEMVLESFREVTAEVDEVKMTLALTNFVENAVKYNKENGYVKVTLDADHQYFVVEVEDSGIGIPEESFEHIFERFYKGKNSSDKSFGVGLALARGIINTQNGTIKAENKKEGGAKFIMRFYKELS